MQSAISCPFVNGTKEGKGNLNPGAESKSLKVYGGRAIELVIGIATNHLIDIAFNFFLYPFVIYKFGILKGGLMMTFLSFLACIATIKFYDWSKRDWIGIETIKSLKSYEGSMWFARLSAWLLRQSDAVIFVYLSINRDPFITTAYLRKGKFNGMSKRDWTIFMGSLLLSNAYWTLACYMGITLFEWGWKAVRGLIG